MSVPGLSGRHQWNEGVVLNAPAGTWPRYKLRRISGLRALPELQDARDLPVGRSAERPRAALNRGKTVIYEGEIRARSQAELDRAVDDLEGELMRGGRDGTMVVASNLDDAAYIVDPSQPSGTNLVTNPSFEAGVGPWVDDVGSGFNLGTSGQSVGAPGAGTYSYRITGTKSPTSSLATIGIRSAAGTSGWKVGPGAPFSLQARVYASYAVDAGPGFQLKIAFYRADGSDCAAPSQNSTPRLLIPGVAETLTVTGLTPADAAYAITYVMALSTSPSDYVDFYVDCVLLSMAAGPIAYFDGSFPGARWLGTPHQSVSQLNLDPPAPVSFTARCTALDVPEQFPAESAQHRATRGFERDFVLALRMSDPRFYAVAEQSIEMGRLGTSIALGVGGTAPTDPVVTITGPVVGPSILAAAVDGSILHLGFSDDVSLAAGETLVLDFANRSARRNRDGPDLRRFLTTKTWWTGDAAGLLPDDGYTVRYASTSSEDGSTTATFTWHDACWS